MQLSNQVPLKPAIGSIFVPLSSIFTFLQTELLAVLIGGGLNAFQTSFKPAFKFHDEPCNILA